MNLKLAQTQIHIHTVYTGHLISSRMSPLIPLLTFLSLLSTSVSGGRDPFSIIQAGWFDVNQGCESFSEKLANKIVMFEIHSGDYLGYKDLNFSFGAIAVKMLIKPFNKDVIGRQIHLRLDSPTSPPFLTYDVYPTNEWHRLITVTELIPLNQQPRDVHDLYITFEASYSTDYVIDLHWFIFIGPDDYCPPAKDPLPRPTAHCPQPEAAIPPTEKSGSCEDFNSDESTKKIDININLQNACCL